jgi:hypothetical protein
MIRSSFKLSGGKASTSLADNNEITPSHILTDKVDESGNIAAEIESFKFDKVKFNDEPKVLIYEDPEYEAEKYEDYQEKKNKNMVKWNREFRKCERERGETYNSDPDAIDTYNNFRGKKKRMKKSSR